MRSPRQDAAAPWWLHDAWVARLRWHFDVYNREYVGGQLRRPLFRISASRSRLGEWHANLRTIAISEQHILAQPWESVLETLRHEMAHQYVGEVLGLEHAPPHAEPFRRACRLLRCDPSPSLDPKAAGSLADSKDERDRILVRIKELLALATSPNEHEAANATRMAHRYLLKYNLDLTQVAQQGEGSYRIAYLGRPTQRVQEYQYILASILQDHFFVLTLWSASYDALEDRPGSILQISGLPENLEMAGYVHDYLLHAAAGLWEERTRTAEAGVPPGSARGRKRRGTKLQYLAGLFHGFKDKLESESRDLGERHGLVWLGDPELQRYFRHHNPRTRLVTTSGVARSSQFQAGVRDGKTISIRRGIDRPSDSRGRLLAGPGES